MTQVITAKNSVWWRLGKTKGVIIPCVCSASKEKYKLIMLPSATISFFNIINTFYVGLLPT